MHMTTKKRKEPTPPNAGSSGVSTVVPTADARAYLQRLADLEAEVARLKSRELGPLDPEKVRIGSLVAAKVGSNSYVSSEVIDIFKSITTGEPIFDVKRLDGGKKSLGLKKADEIFPPERAKPKSN
jgi:hypothetical protein